MPSIWKGLVITKISLSDAVTLALTDTGDVVAWQTKEVDFRGKKSKKVQEPTIIRDWQDKGIVQVYAGEEEGDYASKGRIFAISNLPMWQKKIMCESSKLLSEGGKTVAHRAAVTDNPHVFKIIQNTETSLESLQLKPLHSYTETLEKEVPPPDDPENPGEPMKDEEGIPMLPTKEEEIINITVDPILHLLMMGDQIGNTPMHQCVQTDARIALSGLLAYGIDHTIPDERGWLPQKASYP